MRIIILFTTMLFSYTLMAKDRPLLKCLGEEEKRFHAKKETGPLYDLNQQLISEMLQVPHINIEKESFLEMCTGTNHSESLELLEASLRKGNSLFITPSDITGIQRDMTLGMVDDYVKASKDILLGFIAQIQALSPTPDCLKKEIPELGNFFNEIKYLQSDVDMKIIFKSKDQKILSRLKDYPLAFQRCRNAEVKRIALMKALEKEKAKKKN